MECVNELVVEVLLDTPDAKLDDCDQSTAYGVVASPLVASVLAVHVQVGVVSAVGLVVDGVPGVVGAVTSTVNASNDSLPDPVVFPLLSVARIYMVCAPSAREEVVQVKVSLASSNVPSSAKQADQLPTVEST